MENLVTALAAANDGDGGVVVAPPPTKKVRTGGRSNKRADIPREERLAQNRKAAIESRRRKKVMVGRTWPLEMSRHLLLTAMSMAVICSCRALPACVSFHLLPNMCTCLSSFFFHSNGYVVGR